MLGAMTASLSTLEPIINKAAIKYGLESAAIKAVIEIESNFNPAAYRYEAHLKDASWGLMQLLLSTARETSNNSNLTASELLKPEINIDIGTKYLSKLYLKYHSNIYDTVAAYNAGSVRKTITGQYVNQSHVDRFKVAYLKYKGINIASSILPFIAIGTVGLVAIMTYAKK